MALLALLGSSGSGKDSVTEYFREHYHAQVVPSNTTRTSRPNEDPATSYYRFATTKEEMDLWKQQGDEAWREEFAGEWYATRRSELSPAFNATQLSIIILVPTVVERFEVVARGQDRQYVFIHPKPEQERVALMQARGDTQASITKRSHEAKKFWEAMKGTGVPFIHAWNLTTIPALVRQVEAIVDVRWPGLLPIRLYE